MSDIDRKTQTAIPLQSPDLSDLAAAKHLHRSINPANETDLTSAWIAPTDVLRVSQRSDPLRTTLDLLPHPEVSVELTNSRSKAEPAHTSKGDSPSGLLENPFYRYDGGFLDKILAFFGNILKIVERILMRLIGARDVVAPSHNRQSTPSTGEEMPSESNSQDSARKKRKGRLSRAKLVLKRQ